MTNTCRKVRDAIALEGKAPDNKSLQQHLSACPECTLFLKSVRAIEEDLDALSTPDVDDAVVERLLARPELSAKAGPHKARWMMGLAAAAMIAFVAARVTLMGQAQHKDLEVAETQLATRPNGAGASSGSDDRFAGDELASEEQERLSALGYSSDLAKGQPAELRQNQERLDDRERAQESFEELNERYYRDGGDSDDALFENKNETPKKDSLTHSGESAAASPPAEPESFMNAPIVGGRMEAPIGQTQAGEGGSATTQEKLTNGERDKAREPIEDFRTRIVEPELGDYTYQIEIEPKKLVHVDAVYPEAGKRKRLTGTVVLRVEIDSEGNVTGATVLHSVAGLDQAAIDAALQWKYTAAPEQERRVVTAYIAFEAPAAPNEGARLFLEERERIDNLDFRDARGYWSNTYLPGDPTARFLAMRLRKAHQLTAPHLSSRPVVQPFDAPTRGALAVTLHADHRGVTEPQRLLLQVGVKATESYGRRRPPMNVGIVLDVDADNLSAARALVDSLQQSKALGDRFRLIVPGKGEVVPPDAFRHGPLAVALDEIDTSSELEGAVRLAIERVHAGDDPTMPLGSSLVLVVTPRRLGVELDALSRLAHQSAIGGVPISVVGMGASVDRDELERLALSGQGRRYFLEQPVDATGIVDRELAASSRVIARALRLRIKLTDGVKLVDVIGSDPLSERQTERVREAEKSIDLRLARNLGIEADRGEDEDGIQIVIPSFYAGDTHTILLDVVVSRPGDVAEVTARYKDLSELRNTVAKASLSLTRSEAAPGPLETNVLKNYLAYRLSEELQTSADELDRGDRDAAMARLVDARNLLIGLRLGGDGEIARDIEMLDEYVHVLSSSVEPALVSYLVDSLRYAGTSKRRLPAALT